MTKQDRYRLIVIALIVGLAGWLLRPLPLWRSIVVMFLLGVASQLIWP